MEQSNSAQTISKPLLFSEAQMEAPIFCNIAGGEVCIFSNRSPAKDSANEDATALIPIGDNSGLLIVADGVGGSRAGNQAALIAIETISETIQSLKEDITSLRSAILDGIDLANKRILNLGLGASTTLSLIEIKNGEIRPYHIGDSLILSVGGKGKIKLKPTEHSPTGYAILAGLLNHDDALSHDTRHVVSNVLGDPEMHIEIGPLISIASRDTVLLASDGLSDNLRLDEIIDTIRKGSLSEVSQSLLQLSQERMNTSDNGNPSKPDDLTFIIYRKN